jgi:hypothetical protein
MGALYGHCSVISIPEAGPTSILLRVVFFSDLIKDQPAVLLSVEPDTMSLQHIMPTPMQSTCTRRSTLLSAAGLLSLTSRPTQPARAAAEVRRLAAKTQQNAFRRDGLIIMNIW